MNIERHGVMEHVRTMEVKTEYRLDARFTRESWTLRFYFEYEELKNQSFVEDRDRISRLVWLGLERQIVP